MMAHLCEGEEEGGGTRMRDMLRASPLFPRFAVLSPLIPWQTLMRLQLPGSANSTSIIHPVQLHPLNTPHTHITYTNMHALYLSRARIRAPFPFSPLSTMAWLLAVTVIKALHYLFMADPKYELKPSRGEVTPEAFFQRLLYHSRTDWLLSLKGGWQVLFRLQRRYKVPLCLHLNCIFKVVAVWSATKCTSGKVLTWSKCVTPQPSSKD